MFYKLFLILFHLAGMFERYIIMKQ